MTSENNCKGKSYIHKEPGIFTVIICSKPQTQNKFYRLRNLGVQNQESLPRTALQMPFGMSVCISTHGIVTTDESFVPVTWGKISETTGLQKTS